jgi:hypothetical protein
MFYRLPLKGATTYKKMQPPCTHLQLVVAFMSTISILFEIPPIFHPHIPPYKTTKATEISDFTLYQNRSFNMSIDSDFDTI